MEKNKSSFSLAAANYDTIFTHSEIGKRQRARVYYWLSEIGFYKTSKKVFEVNCGTGYDAEQFIQSGHEVIATDASDEMIQIAKRKRNKSIQFFQLAFQDLTTREEFAAANSSRVVRS